MQYFATVNQKSKEMKKVLYVLVIVLFMLTTGVAQKLSPFYDCGQVKKSLVDAKNDLKAKLTENGFKITGGYYVAGNKNWYVLTVSTKELQTACYKVKEKGLFAANLRVGFINKNGVVKVSALNPKYLFVGYLRDGYYSQKALLDKISEKFLSVMKTVSGKLTPFGGEVEEKDLKKYHYMFGMPYFDDFVEVNEFSDFNKAVETITKNLKNGKHHTRMVYKLVYPKSKKAVFGVGLLDKETGEPHFLPIIGESHLAAMPYELVVYGNKVYMLHGRFRFAFYWPSLTMSEFTKIMSTPGDVEDTMEDLTK